MNIIAVLLPAPLRAGPVGPFALVVKAMAAATLANVVFCHSIVAGRLPEDNLELGERPERQLGERPEGVKPG